MWRCKLRAEGARFLAYFNNKQMCREAEFKWYIFFANTGNFTKPKQAIRGNMIRINNQDISPPLACLKSLKFSDVTVEDLS